MKINSNGYIAKIYQNHQRADQVNTKNQAVKTDNIQLSESARKISELIKETKELPEVREEKIALIKAKVQDGTYHISAQQLAAKMLSAD